MASIDEQKVHRSYFLWEFGKPPDFALETVSNQQGEKKRKYAERKLSEEQQRIGHLLALLRQAGIDPGIR